MVAQGSLNYPTLRFSQEATGDRLDFASSSEEGRVFLAGEALQGFMFLELAPLRRFIYGDDAPDTNIPHKHVKYVQTRPKRPRLP